MTRYGDELPGACYAAEGARALDERFVASAGITGFALMRRAGQAAFAALAGEWPAARSLAIICGPGNNGGDGFVIARAAFLAGWQVHVFCLAGVDRLAGDAARAAQAYQSAGGEIVRFRADTPLPDVDVVVDAILGIGVNRDVEGDYAIAIAAINRAGEAGCGVFAVDVPSGLDADVGRIHASAVHADATITFIGLKLGLLTGAGPSVCGRLGFDDLDAPADVASAADPVAHRVDTARVRQQLPPRDAGSYKNRNGHVLCLGGNRGMGGSIRLSAEAALRAGAGLVSVGCHPDHAAAMSQARPELMCSGVHSDDDLSGLLASADVIALGPGLGDDDWSACLWRAALASNRPLIVDADGLNRLAREPAVRGNWILTPHVGEAARLLGESSAAIGADRPAAARALADRYAATVVLKGAGSLIAGGERLAISTTGNPGMAVGGMGDLLTGVIAGLCAQGLNRFEAAAVGVRVHGWAGDQVAAHGGERGLLPADLLDYIRCGVNPEPC